MQKRIWQATFSLTISLFVASGTLQAQPYVMVTDDGFSFTPDPVYIVAGEVVYWIDDGTGPYTIYSNNGDWVPFATPGGLYFNQPGTYAYYDDAGDFGTVYVSANTPPSVTITNPTNNAVFTAPASFTFAADASDSDADGLSDVEFYVGTNLVDDVFSSPFATSVTDLTAGSYTLTVIAYDNVGATATNSITITVQNSASITLTALNLAAGQFWFNAIGLTVGKTNILQASTNLASSANWVSIKTNVSISGSTSFTNAVSGGRCFFRLLQLP
jgi:plastocyanin